MLFGSWLPFSARCLGLPGRLFSFQLWCLTLRSVDDEPKQAERQQ